MTKDEINKKLDEASIGKIVLHDDRGGSGVWVCNLHFSHRPPPNGYYGEGEDIFAAIEDAVRKKERGGGWVVATVCPVGIGPGLAPIALLAKCVRCQVARRARRRREVGKRGHGA